MVLSSKTSTKQTLTFTGVVLMQNLGCSSMQVHMNPSVGDAVITAANVHANLVSPSFWPMPYLLVHL